MPRTGFVYARVLCVCMQGFCIYMRVLYVSKYDFISVAPFKTKLPSAAQNTDTEIQLHTENK